MVEIRPSVGSHVTRFVAARADGAANASAVRASATKDCAGLNVTNDLRLSAALGCAPASGGGRNGYNAQNTRVKIFITRYAICWSLHLDDLPHAGDCFSVSLSRV